MFLPTPPTHKYNPPSKISPFVSLFLPPSLSLKTKPNRKQKKQLNGICKI